MVGYCWAGLYLAGELLRADGFTDVRYVQGDKRVDNTKWLAGGVTDFDFNMPSMHIRTLEAGAPIKVLTGVHVGCFELKANNSINRIEDLKGKRVGVWAVNDHPHLFLSLMANYVGLDPVHDIHWVEGASPMQGFIDGKVDAFLAGAGGNREGARRENRPHDRQQRRRPSLVTVFLLHRGRAARTIWIGIPWLPSVSCVPSSRPPTSALRTRNWRRREMIDRGFVTNYDYALATLKENPHDKWREFDPEDSIRFYALRLQETGMIKSSPQQIIAEGTDFRFLNELKRELKT